MDSVFRSRNFKSNVIGRAKSYLALVTLLTICEGCGGSATVGPGPAPPTFRISPYVAQNGIISPSSSQIVPKGGVGPRFVATANQGYSFAGWLIDGAVTPQWTTALGDGSSVSISANQLKFDAVKGSHRVSASFSGKSLTISVYSNFLPYFAGPPDFPQVLCSSLATYAESGGGIWDVEVIAQTPIRVLPYNAYAWGVQEQGWVLYSNPVGQASEIALLDKNGVTHTIVSSASASGQYAINNSNVVMYNRDSPGSSDNPQYYVQKAWDAASAMPISPDVQGFFLNDAGAIIGTSYGLNSIPKGAPVAYINGQEVSLPGVEGVLSAFSSTGILATVPSAHRVNLYSNNGQSLAAQISNLDIDTIFQGSGGVSNPFNRLIGCNAAGDIKIIGQSTASGSNGDWGYWDSQAEGFVDVSAVVNRTLPMFSSSNLGRKVQFSKANLSGSPQILKLWCITDNDLMLATVGNPGLPAGGLYMNVAISIMQGGRGKEAETKLRMEIR